MKCNYKNRDARNKRVKIECECGKAFLSGDISLHSRMIDDVEETFYNCPYCGKEFTVIKTNPEIRELMAHRNKMNGFAYKSDSEIKEYEKLDKLIKRKIDEFNGKAVKL